MEAPKDACIPEIPERRGSYLAISVFRGGVLRERLNLHIDEAGNQDLSEGLYLAAVVLHEHAVDIEGPRETDSRI